MIARILTAYQIEIAKAIRQRFTYVGPGLLLIAVLLAAYIKRDESPGNGYTFIAYITAATLNLPGLLLLLAFCSALIATEVHSGTARFIFVRSLRRSEFVIAKLLLGFTYALALMAVVAIASWVVASLRGGLIGVSYGGELLFTGQEMLTSYLIGLALAVLPLAGAVAFAIMISAWVRTSGAAITVAVGVWLVMDMLKYGLGIQRYIFSTYWDVPWAVFEGRSLGLNPEWMPNAAWCAATSIVSCIVFTVIACIGMQRRNLHS